MGMIRTFELARPRNASVLVFLVTLALCLVMPWQHAFAHAVLVSSTPAQGERLTSRPLQLSLRFSEAVTRVDLTLVDRNAKPANLPATISGNDVVVELAEPLGEGAYALNWRILSEDGHPVAASVVFAVGASYDMSELKDDTGGAERVALLTLGTKFLFYLACLFGIGGSFFSFWIAHRAPTRTTITLLYTAAVCAVFLIGLLAVENSASWAALLGAKAWADALDSSLARSIFLVGLTLLLAVCARPRSIAGKALTFASLALIGPAFALTGHASGAGIKWLSFAAVSLHVTAVCFWAGSLPGLWHVLGPRHQGQRDSLLRFSAAIPYSIAVMLVAGGYLAYVQVGWPPAILGFDYGKVLLAKVTLVSGALVLGAWNRLVLTPRVASGCLRAAKSMKNLVSVEVFLVVLVLAVTSLWRFTPPPRALALRQPIATSVHLQDAETMAMLAFETTPDLIFNAEISLSTAEFAGLDPHEVTLEMSSVDGSVSKFKVPIRRVSPGFWSVQHVPVPCDCEWNVRLDLLISDFDLVSLQSRVKLLSGG
ncbi:hypothetical protein ASD52_34825 [Ensifer sp. Root142]|nr:hypothetical protein ASD52_34825 [Ensifer sp. Root142]